MLCKSADFVKDLTNRNQMICYIGVGSHHQNRKRKSNDLTCRHSLARSNKKDGFVATSNGLVRGLSMEQDATEGFQNGTIGNLLWMQVRLMTIEKCTCAQHMYWIRQFKMERNYQQGGNLSQGEGSS
jgi:hypothetical protein